MKPPAHRSAFSLIEMLVAMAVLSLLVVLLAQVISMSSDSITLNSRRMDSVNGARFVLDQIGEDLTARVRRSDVSHDFKKSANNDEIAFYSEVPAHGGERKIAVVRYLVKEDATSKLPYLHRAAVGTTWTQDYPLAFLPNALPSVKNSDFDILNESVLRFEFCYLKNDGLLSNIAKDDLSDVTGIVVGVALLDKASRTLLSDAQIKNIQDRLSDVPDGQTPLQVWGRQLQEPAFAGSLPPKSVRALRIAQRLYYVR